MQEVRKWMPPKTRASAISAAAAEKLANDRVPGRTSESTLKAVYSPNTDARMKAAAPLALECADGYSGSAGAPDGKKSSHGSQLGSGAKPAVPLRIAAIGLQET